MDDGERKVTKKTFGGWHATSSSFLPDLEIPRASGSYYLL
jgi:hypothetical protein